MSMEVFWHDSIWIEEGSGGAQPLIRFRFLNSTIFCLAP